MTHFHLEIEVKWQNQIILLATMVAVQAIPDLQEVEEAIGETAMVEEEGLQDSFIRRIFNVETR